MGRTPNLPTVSEEWRAVTATQATEVRVVTRQERRCTRCSCRLSRYNSTDLCSACSRGMGAARPCVPPQVWQHEDVKEALLHRDFGMLCLLVRERGGLRQEDMSTLTELSQSFLSLLESGRRRLTNIDRIVSLLDGLGAPVDVTGPMLRPSGRRGTDGVVPDAVARSSA